MTQLALNETHKGVNQERHEKTSPAVVEKVATFTKSRFLKVMEGGELSQEQIIDEMQRLYTPETFHYILSSYERRERFVFRGLKIGAFASRFGIKGTFNHNPQAKASLAYEVALKIWPGNPLFLQAYEAALKHERAYEEKMSSFRVLSSKDVYHIGRVKTKPENWIAAASSPHKRDDFAREIFGVTLYQVFNHLGLRYPGGKSPLRQESAFLHFALLFHPENEQILQRMQQMQEQKMLEKRFNSLTGQYIIEGLSQAYTPEEWLELSESMSRRKTIVFEHKDINALAKKMGYKLTPSQNPIDDKIFFLRIGFEKLWVLNGKLQHAMSAVALEKQKRGSFEDLLKSGGKEALLAEVRKKYSPEDLVKMASGYYGRSTFTIRGVMIQRVASVLGVTNGGQLKPINHQVDFLAVALCIYPDNELLLYAHKKATQAEQDRKESKAFLETHTPETLAALIRDFYTEQAWIRLAETSESRNGFSIKKTKIIALATKLGYGTKEVHPGASPAGFLKVGLLIWKDSTRIQQALSAQETPAIHREKKIKHISRKKMTQYILDHYTPESWLQIASSPQKIRELRLHNYGIVGAATVLGKDLKGYHRASSNPLAFLDLGMHLWPNSERLRQAFERLQREHKHPEKWQTAEKLLRHLQTVYTPTQWIELSQTKPGRKSVVVEGAGVRSIAQTLGMQYPSGFGPLQVVSVFLELGLSIWPGDPLLLQALEKEKQEERLTS